MSSKLFEGYSVKLPQFLTVEETPDRTERKIGLPVMTGDGVKNLSFSEKDLSKHILTIGGIGTGKTNLINLLLSQIIENSTEDDVVVIFDTKGDFLRNFGKPGDIAFTNTDDLPNGVARAKWNIYREATIDPGKESENLIEICKSMFLERSVHTTNPFFPNAARDVLYGYMISTIRGINSNEHNNNSLVRFFQSLDVDRLRDIFSQHEDLKSCLYYIDGKNQQTQGVISEVVQMVREIFVESFAQNGTTSIRQLVRDRKRKVFIEYDLSLGNMLTPVYRILLDMVIKEALSRSAQARRGNVFVVIDEFSLLPKLQHITDGVNFGRELGIKFLVGLQSIEQLYEAYGEYASGSILSGFSTRFFFKVNDNASRSYIQNLLGKNRVIQSFSASERVKGTVDELYTGNVLEDWVFDKLPVGATVFYKNGSEAEIIGLPEYQGIGKPPKNMFAVKHESEGSMAGFKRIT